MGAFKCRGWKGEGVEGYTLTQQQQLGLGGSGVCIVLCAKATNRSHFLIPRGWLHRHYISRTLWWVMGNMVFAPQLFFCTAASDYNGGGELVMRSSVRGV